MSGFVPEIADEPPASVDRLAPWFQGVAHANPVYYAIMGFRFGFIGTVDSTISHPVLTAALVVAAFVSRRLGGATTPGTQPNPLLDNYEGLALGPRLPGGRRSLLLQSDDNFSAGQVTRVVALGVVVLWVVVLIMLTLARVL